MYLFDETLYYHGLRLETSDQRCEKKIDQRSISALHLGIGVWQMPHGFSIGFVLNVTNLVMVLMAKLRY